MRDIQVQVTVTVTCDRCQGANRVTRGKARERQEVWPMQHAIHSFAYDSFTDARAESAQGYTNIDGRDLCPHCTDLVRSVMRAVATD